MSDITELAQSLKAAAIDAKELAIIARYSKGRAAAEKFYALANPNNVIALVEALEKAQRANAAQDDHINQQQDRIDQLEKGHQEAAKQINSWRRMAKQNIAEREKDIAELDAARQRIAELESRTVTAAAAAVLAERKRQVAAEGWTPGHDDEYEHGELADAAGCYALSSELFDCAGEPPRPWPWPDEWWKPTNRRRDLVKAGALILAEIERLDRAAGIKVEAE
ncbi:ead/Ea22-like family protein [Klebsiella pneumoniae]|uniref:ead/Ea22-like family protein n=2 Tax=Klebsiella pneumoniae TaxID=573 RepID=UPI000E2AD06B|nr:ead/Ea22-like family protein [Klebsiella pneumoniae]MBZ1901924.1 ead/Ea22-like family protein [Klebsiella pneumoniae]MCK9838463.1 ead/Ea22-like family protein [Klebsiella pneumoniae]MDZ5881399.1 ead/Ea22-like family protein [Klebsiella pneumoniae]MDZ5888806.1 ead/Ea22-like family protein [Klebsiella pneumoniae]MDZ5897105.1 ead/Ea22-like family protein [Klebsiella pneumoniae]